MFSFRRLDTWAEDVAAFSLGLVLIFAKSTALTDAPLWPDNIYVVLYAILRSYISILPYIVPRAMV